jgi:hypothetical protein
MGSLKLRALEPRLARLEARVAAIPDPEEEKEQERILRLYLDVWDRGGTLEDVPEKDRDPGTWKVVSDYAPVYTGMVWEGLLEGREEHLAEGFDFTRLEGVDEDDVAAARAGVPGLSDPKVAPKRRGNRSLTKEEYR